MELCNLIIEHHEDIVREEKNKGNSLKILIIILFLRKQLIKSRLFEMVSRDTPMK